MVSCRILTLKKVSARLVETLGKPQDLLRHIPKSMWDLPIIFVPKSEEVRGG
jgi:hypothetical protein